MQTQNRLLDDLARMASGAINTFSSVRDEVEARVRERVERWAADLDLVTREEFEAVKEMAAKARAEQAALAAKLEQLEAELAGRGAKPARAPRKRKASTTKTPSGPAA